MVTVCLTDKFGLGPSFWFVLGEGFVLMIEVW
jgi:hypothetical protein